MRPDGRESPRQLVPATISTVAAPSSFATSRGPMEATDALRRPARDSFDRDRRGAPVIKGPGAHDR